MKMMTTCRTLLAALLAAASFTAGSVRADDDFDQSAGTPTFTEDIAPIFNKNCVSCHRPGEGSPMMLTSYAEARPWAKSIRKAVQERVMPPWDADPVHGKWINDISLTEKQIATISKWVDGGAPEGDPAKLPVLPNFTEGWQLGEPDYIIDLDEVAVPAAGPDIFPNLSAKIDIPKDRWVRAVEVRPGNKNVLHHVVVFMTNIMKGGGFVPDFLVVWAVGTPPAAYPEGIGREVSKGSQVIVNMHYHPNGTAQTDKTKIGLYFGEGEMKKVLTGQFAGNVNFAIPPRDSNHVITSSYTIDEDIDVISFFPHMHQRGKSMKYTATYPDGKSEVLLNVPKYDFNWQWFYYPDKPVRLPVGTRIDLEAHYDNSASNPNNPDPDAELTFGEGSNDEMMFGAYEFVAVNGREPRPLDLNKKVADILAAVPPEQAFKVTLSLGFLTVPTAFVLPKEGEGVWHFPLGRQLMEIPIKNIAWKGETFAAEVNFLGQKGGKINGTVDASGALKGQFDLKNMQMDDLPLVGGDQSQATSMFRLAGFEGQRIGG